MFCFKDGRLYTEGLSFKLPDGFYLITEAETVSEESVSVTDSKGAYTVTWETQKGYGREDTKEVLEEMISEEEYKYMGSIESIEHNGLKGHHLRYKSKYHRREYYERRYELSNYRQFGFIIEAGKNVSIDDILSRPEVIDMIDSIRAEPVSKAKTSNRNKYKLS